MQTSHKYFLALLMVVGAASRGFAQQKNATAPSSLNQAFQEEYAFLNAQKRALTGQIEALKAESAKAVLKAQGEIAGLEQKHSAISNGIDKENQRYEAILAAGEDAAESNDAVSGTLLQIQESMTKYKHLGSVKLPDFSASTEENANPDVMSLAQKALSQMGSAVEVLGKIDDLHVENGSFFLPDGTKAQGKISFIGNIAAYGEAPQYQGSLSPAGSGELKAIKADTTQSAQAVSKMLSGGGGSVDRLKLYLFESPHSEPVEQHEQTWVETIHSGGRVAWAIFYLGIIAGVMTLVRFILLQRSSTNSRSITREVGKLVAQEKLDAAIVACQKRSGVIAKVLEKTLNNINKPRMFIEDIVNETIIHESRLIDKFGSFIIVTSTVAPLLGLLGTVAGMIATFNMLTEYGTGNPKLLSGGISEALICTMLGLMVAIPALLLGSLMNGWADKIKDDMAHAALHITNIFQNRNKAAVLSQADA